MFEIEDIYRKKNIPGTIYFSEPLFKKLKETAQRGNISFSRLVLQCCQYALNDMEDNAEQILDKEI